MKRLIHLCLLFILLSCGGGKRQRDALIIGLINDVSSLNPLLTTSSVDNDVQGRLFLTLLEEQPDFTTFKPRLAKSWEFSPDGKKITFHLRGDVYWIDGVKVTARDVRFTWLKQRDPQIAWIHMSTKAHIRDVQVVNDSTVAFIFSKTYPYQLMDANEGYILPEHILKDLEGPEWRTTTFNRNPVTNGPYKLRRWVSQQFIELVANESYYEPGKPRIKRVIFKIVPDQTALLTQLETGEIDVMEGLPPKDVERISERGDIEVVRFPDLQYVYIAWNGRDPLFQNVRIRRALTMAIDRQAIIRSVYYGFAQECISPIVPLLWAYNQRIKPLPYDPASARSILKAEGWIDHNGDGWIDKDGKKFEFELMTNYGNQIRRDIMIMVQAQLKEIGIKVNLRTYEWTVFSEKLRKGDYQAAITGWRVGTKVELRSFWHSSQIGRAGFNRVFYCNPVVDRLIDRAEEILDRKEALPLWHRLQEIIYNDQPVTFLYVPQRIVGVNKRIKGYQMNPLSVFYNLRDWYIRCSSTP